MTIKPTEKRRPSTPPGLQDPGLDYDNYNIPVFSPPRDGDPVLGMDFRPGVTLMCRHCDEPLEENVGYGTAGWWYASNSGTLYPFHKDCVKGYRSGFDDAFIDDGTTPRKSLATDTNAIELIATVLDFAMAWEYVGAIDYDEEDIGNASWAFDAAGDLGLILEMAGFDLSAVERDAIPPALHPYWPPPSQIAGTIDASLREGAVPIE